MSGKIKKIILIVLSVILLAAIGVGAYFIARDVIAESKSEGSTEIQQPEQPVDPAPPADPETPTQPSEPEKPSISVGSSLKIAKDWISIADTDWYSADLSEYEIGTVEELAGLAKLSQESVKFENKEINLTNDISLQSLYENDFMITSIKTFSGIFNGNDYTISGFFGRYNLFNIIDGGTIKNLSFNVDQASASLVGTVQSDAATFKNIEVTGTFNNNTSLLGGIVSAVGFYGSALFDNCNVDITFVLNGQVGYYGGLIGCINSFGTTAVTVSNCDINMSVNGEIVQSIGGLFGYSNNVPITIANSSVNFVDSYVVWDNIDFQYSFNFIGVSGVGLIEGTTAETSSSIDCDVTGELKISTSIDSSGKFYEISNVSNITNSTSNLTVIVSSDFIDWTCPWGKYIGGYYGQILSTSITDVETGFVYNTQAYIISENGVFYKAFAFYDKEKDILNYLSYKEIDDLSDIIKVIDYDNGKFLVTLDDLTFNYVIENQKLNVSSENGESEGPFVLCKNLIKVEI